MAFNYGEKFKISVFGQSHSEAIGVTIEGVPAGTEIDIEKLEAFMKRRAPGGAFSTPRKETDIPSFVSGVNNNVANGAPITAIIYNTNARPSDYSDILRKPRPGHSDYPAFIKFNGQNDVAGGGHFSGRMTAPICIAGAIAIQELEKIGIKIFAHLLSVGDIYDDDFNSVNPNINELEKIKNNDFPTVNQEKALLMKSLITETRTKGDSVGGRVQCIVTGLNCGLGDAGFGGLDGAISYAVFGIPGVKGIEFGNGFDCTELNGSTNNDAYYYDGDVVKTKTNNCGGILGGISNGMPIVFDVAFKPTPSISLEQDTIDIVDKCNTKLSVVGRHDPCIAVRAVPVVEAVAAIAIYNKILEG
jgi:chorismate synthase